MNKNDFNTLAAQIRKCWFEENEPIPAILDRAVTQYEKGLDLDFTIVDDEEMAEAYGLASVLHLLGQVIHNFDPKLYNILLAQRDPDC